MKVLYVSSGLREDYQRDVLFHGLRELLGRDVVDVGRIASLYDQPDEIKHAMYGRGYSVYADLPEIEVDRASIGAKIQARYFDLVIYGSIHRCSEYLPEVLKHYPPSRVVFIDGEDATRVKWPLLGKGIYFKRELLQPLEPFLQPIHFAVPAQKFLSDQAFEDSLQRKKQVFAPCDPRDRSTYIFNTEPAYYQQYQESYFGITMKKAGWDCMRHHEIVARGTAPYFLDLEACPRWTLHKLPRPLLMELRELVDHDKEMTSPTTRARYSELMRKLFTLYMRNFTTVALAEHVLGTVADSAVLDRARKSPWVLQSRRLLNAFRHGKAVSA
jgi:hypothetical protein